MSKHSNWIVELKESGIDKETLNQPAKSLNGDALYKLIYRSQYKLENQGLYVARYDSYDEQDQTYDADEPYDTFLEHSIKDYLKQFDQVREGAQQHFHQEMTVGYLIDYYIALLHRRFENHQEHDSLVLVNGYEKEVD